MPLVRLVLGLSTLLVAAISFVGPATPRAAAADCERSRPPIFDGGGYIYDFFPGTSVYSALTDGGSNGPAGEPPGPVKVDDAWDDWGNIFVYAPGADLKVEAENVYEGPDDGCAFSLGGQEIAFPVVPLHGLEVQRRWYVDPGPLHGARSLIVLRNPSTAPIPVTVALGNPGGFGTLGSDERTRPNATSDGTGIFSPASFWGVTSDGLPIGGVSLDLDSALAHVWDGAGGALRTSEVVLNPGILREDVLYWDWKVSVPAGETVALISYEIQAAVPSRETTAEVAQAVAQAEARQKQSPASLYLGMSAAEIDGTLNWPRPAATAAIAPVRTANAASQVKLDGSVSAGPAGLPQCAVSGYSWEADDGAKGTGPVLSHFFGPGRHSATLTVTNNCGGPPSSAKTSFKVAPGIQLGKLKLNRRTGTARLQVKALGAGKLTVSAKGLGKQVRRVKRAGKVSLVLKPTGKALRALRRSGKAKLKLRLSLQPRGGEVSTLSKTVTLQLHA